MNTIFTIIVVSAAFLLGVIFGEHSPFLPDRYDEGFKAGRIRGALQLHEAVFPPIRAGDGIELRFHRFHIIEENRPL